jgi:hypothetical protein
MSACSYSARMNFYVGHFIHLCITLKKKKEERTKEKSEKRKERKKGGSHFNFQSPKQRNLIVLTNKFPR